MDDDEIRRFDAKAHGIACAGLRSVHGVFSKDDSERLSRLIENTMRAQPMLSPGEAIKHSIATWKSENGT